MTNFKAILNVPWVKYKISRCKKLAKKAKLDNSNYSLERRYIYLRKAIKKLMKILNVQVVVQGKENLGSNGPALLLGNHQDNSDPLIIALALMDEQDDKESLKIATFLAKIELKYSPNTRWPLELIDTFFIDRNNPRNSYKEISEFGKFIKNKKTYGVIFPEGTRNKEGGVSEFKNSPFKIAQKEYIPIIPFTINNSVTGLTHKRKEKLIVEVIFHKKLPASSFATQTSQALASRVEKIVSSSHKKPDNTFIEDFSENKQKKMEKLKNKYEKEIFRINENEKKKKLKIEKQEKKIKEDEEKEIKKYLENQENKKNKKR